MPYKRNDSPIWWASFTGPGGKRVRRSTETTSLKQAKALEAKWRSQAYQQRHWDEQPARSFDELMLNYLRAREPELADPRRYRAALQHLRPAFTGREVNSVRPDEIRAYIAQRKEAGAAASTINKEVGLFSAAVNYARRWWGWSLSNPAKDCRQREPEGRVRWLSFEEVDRLLRAATLRLGAPHLVDFIRLALNTGCRKSELLGLEWKRVNWDHDLLFLEAVHTKTSKRRSVPLNRQARQALESRWRFRMAHCAQSPWVFCDREGHRVTDVKHSFKSACREAGIEDFRVHDLRHTCAALLVSDGVPLAEVRDLLGHKSVEMTLRYAHLAPERVRQAVTRLDAGWSRFSHAGLRK